MRIVARIAIGLLATGLAGLTLAQGQASHAPYSIKAQTATLDEAGLSATLTLNGGVHFTRSTEAVTASHATLTLHRPTDQGGVDTFVPTTLTAAGGMHFADPATGQTASANQGNYEFAGHQLRLTGSVRFEQSGPDGFTVLSGSCLAGLESHDLEAGSGVTATLTTATGLLPSEAAAVPMQVVAPNATWSAATGVLTASGGNVTLTQGDLTLNGARIVATITNGTVQALTVAGPLRCSGDLEGLHQMTTLTASSATYDPVKHLLTLEGPITVKQGNRSSSASQALATLAPTRRMRLIGLRVSGPLESEVPATPDH